MHSSLINQLTEIQRRSCPCGAVPEPSHGLCRKCFSGMVWRRRKAKPVRHATRRRRGWQAHERARSLALAEAKFHASGKWGDL
ncbi:MAG TPA: hypothetical protein VN969_09155 [Streptosporangiaceae bacterium]|nr:hypothetical protein [Streptosporangiaceae bacterium]